MAGTEVETKEIAVVKGQATKALSAAQELTITDQTSYEAATDHLSKMKKVGKMIKERKEAITKPLMDALNSARDLFKPIEQDLASAEKVVKGKMLDYQEKVDAEAEKERQRIADSVESGRMKETTAVKKMEKIEDAPTSAQGKVGASSTRTIKKYRVTNESLIPREFLVPDMGKITEALKAGREVPGAEVYEEKVIAAR